MTDESEELATLKNEFLEHFDARLALGQSEHGFASMSAEPGHLVGEIGEEAIDIPVWSLFLYGRIKRLGLTIARLRAYDDFAKRMRERLGADGRRGHSNAHGIVQQLHNELQQLERTQD